MVDYIGKMIYEIPEYMRGEYATPATHHLFDIEEDASELSQTDEDEPFQWKGHVANGCKKN